TLKLPGWLVCLFFIPFLNFPFFAILCMLQHPLVRSQSVTSSKSKEGVGRFIPQSGTGSAIMAVVLTGLLVAAFVGFNATVFKRYGWGLFVFLPFIHGLLAAWLYGYHQPRNLSDCQLIAFCSCLLAGGCMIAFAIEGAICIAMAAPIWMTLAAIGAWVGWLIQHARWEQMERTFALLFCASCMPFLMGAEYALHPKPPIMEATTSVDIQAPPAIVWNHVVAFSELPPPTEWIFKTGLSYPIRARIKGSGVGAIRHCEFSTGIFVEPIQVWDKPRLLRFSVVNTPSPMKEMSLYSHIEPPHLKGYMLSRQGQFLLTSLPGGGTRLEGTTWYEHNLWPARYWELWSDYIIHQIHMRVLRHIKTLAESDSLKGSAHG